MVVLCQRERHGPADRGREPAHPRHLAIGRGEVLTERARRRELEHAPPQLAEHPSDAEQLVFGCERPGHRFAVDRHVRDRPARREAERTRLDALLHDASHRFDVFGSRGLVLGAPLPHHVAAHRAVRHLRAHVEQLGHRVDGIEVLGERLPLPLDPGRQRRTRDVFDAFHQADQPVVTVGLHRREADTAVPHHDGGHAVPARRREHRVPRDLPVEVRVHVDEAGRHQQPVGVEHFARGAVDATDFGDDTVGDGDVGSARGRARTVDDGAALHHEVVHGHRTSLKKLRMSSISRSGSSSAAK